MNPRTGAVHAVRAPFEVAGVLEGAVRTAPLTVDLADLLVIPGDAIPLLTVLRSLEEAWVMAIVGILSFALPLALALGRGVQGRGVWRWV